MRLIDPSYQIRNYLGLNNWMVKYLKRQFEQIVETLPVEPRLRIFKIMSDILPQMRDILLQGSFMPAHCLTCKD